MQACCCKSLKRLSAGIGFLCYSLQISAVFPEVVSRWWGFHVALLVHNCHGALEVFLSYLQPPDGIDWWKANKETVGSRWSLFHNRSVEGHCFIKLILALLVSLVFKQSHSHASHVFALPEPFLKYQYTLFLQFVCLFCLLPPPPVRRLGLSNDTPSLVRCSLFAYSVSLISVERLLWSNFAFLHLRVVETVCFVGMTIIKWLKKGQWPPKKW